MPPHLERDIRALLDRGDAGGAATAAIRGYGPQVLRYLRSLLPGEDDVKDAFSEFAEVLWTSLPRFRGEASVRTWAFKLAWTAAVKLHREPWRRRARRLATGEASAIAEDVRTGSLGRDERRRQELERLRQALSLDERSLVELRIDHELSWAEIAEVLAAGGERVPPRALAKRFERLKRRLARIARREGLLE